MKLAVLKAGALVEGFKICWAVELDIDLAIVYSVVWQNLSSPFPHQE